MKILLAADGSPFTRSTARHLATHMHWFAGMPDIHLVHVHAPAPVPDTGRGRARGGGDALHREESEAALAIAENELREAGIPHRSAWKVGDAAERLMAYVGEHGMDLVLMGARGHGNAAGMALGSVATKCIAVLEVPVMVVRSARVTRPGVTREDEYGESVRTRVLPVKPPA